ncbi:ABC transporter substrate-binding protein [Glycomyces tritici]|uniref:ABC transporter substrate-binding protein n=1 Tax=Glycomyces tritici TaxID=2665176 RepID=A0ABT7YLJ4_9ACTN|nr:ABC transporter substrate-binding protein [Glycomyces tritici]MDN3239514.1 ABC transporter substrate-binding protein [Glycomyces tritici]
MSVGVRASSIAVSASVLLAVLASCGASEPVPETEAAAGEGATVYPLTVENCGEELTFDAAPQRAVSLDQDSTEILLSLGLEDRMVGTASWTDPVLEHLAAANDTVPRLAEEAPTYEVVMGADPDFVTASHGRHYAQGGVAERSRFAETGIGAYLAPTDCDGDISINGGGTRTQALTFDSLYQTIRDFAAIFDVQSRGEALVADLEARRQAAVAGVEASGLTAAVWFSDLKTPYMGGGLGSANLLATEAGAVNVFADQDDDWPVASWETVVDLDPDVLVLADLSRERWPGDQAAEKIEFLENDPVTKGLTAVTEQRYVSLRGAEINPGIRIVDGLETLAAALQSFQGEA